MSKVILLAAALLTCVVGMGWIALAMEAHWTQVCISNLSRTGVLRLRTLGILSLVMSLGLCVAADHASMAVPVWVMALAVAALTVALTLTWRAHWLKILAWVAGKGKEE